MSREKGDVAEERAAAYLREKGFVVVKQNFYSRFGEIDIIASKEGVLHVVEVKSGEEYESAINNITPAKLRKIIKTAQVYMKKNSYEGDVSIDALIVTPESIEFVENITI